MRLHLKLPLALLALLGLTSQDGRAAWSQLHGNAAHDGFVPESVPLPLRLAWADEFDGERIGTAVEPIVADGRVFVTTHDGNVHGLDAVTGAPVWRFAAHGPFLSSPAAVGSNVVAAGGDGFLYGLEVATGRLGWHRFVAYGGFSAAPVADEETVYVGTRSGRLVAVRANDGAVRWSQDMPAPIRQTAALAGGRVFVTAEDLRVRCFRARDGERLWTSAPLPGQSARDGYPMVMEAGGRSRVLVRTNPGINMAQRLARDRTCLSRNAGIDDRDWRNLDAWVKSPATAGSPTAWAREQEVIGAQLRADPDARCWFMLDAATGEECPGPPVFWTGGCQGVANAPARLADGRWLVEYRSVYGNWNHGVAPLVALGRCDADRNFIEPLFHRQGAQPPWNTFWGTADEAQNFSVAGGVVFIAHQGTLSGFEVATSNLFAIHGERDTYGGWRNPAWARNEWHGPARSGVAIDHGRVFWLTGSRLLCLTAGGTARRDGPTKIREAQAASTSPAPQANWPDEPELRRRLAVEVAEVISQTWAPLWLEPGLAGREFLFDESREAFEALAWAYPHLPAELQVRVAAWLERELVRHFPAGEAGRLPLTEGTRREWAPVPAGVLVRVGLETRPHPFAGVAAMGLYAQRLGAAELLRAYWPRLKQSLADFHASGWRLDPAVGDLHANRYAASMLAIARLAEVYGERELAESAGREADAMVAGLAAWWERAAAEPALGTFAGSAALDAFINRGDALWFRVAPHRLRLALFEGLSPELATRIQVKAPAAVASVWARFGAVAATWDRVGEERQVHTGENFVDSPRMAEAAFEVLTWLAGAERAERVRRVDLPAGRADLYHVIKLALALEPGPG